MLLFAGFAIRGCRGRLIFVSCVAKCVRQGTRNPTDRSIGNSACFGGDGTYWHMGCAATQSVLEGSGKEPSSNHSLGSRKRPINKGINLSPRARLIECRKHRSKEGTECVCIMYLRPTSPDQVAQDDFDTLGHIRRASEGVDERHYGRTQGPPRLRQGMHEIAAVDGREKIARLSKRIPDAEVIIRRQLPGLYCESNCGLRPYAFNGSRCCGYLPKWRIITEQDPTVPAGSEDCVQVGRVKFLE
jgi:hypothetical protein